jgi:hypothetical protein
MPLPTNQTRSIKVIYLYIRSNNHPQPPVRSSLIRGRRKRHTNSHQVVPLGLTQSCIVHQLQRRRPAVWRMHSYSVVQLLRGCGVWQLKKQIIFSHVVLKLTLTTNMTLCGSTGKPNLHFHLPLLLEDGECNTGAKEGSGGFWGVWNPVARANEARCQRCNGCASATSRSPASFRGHKGACTAYGDLYVREKLGIVWGVSDGSTVH